MKNRYGAERFEDGASQINKSDMFYGDDGTIGDDDLEHIDAITMDNVQYVKMDVGDVVLLDNYICMHGRNVFDGTRKHGVAWFEGWEGEDEMRREGGGSTTTTTTTTTNPARRKAEGEDVASVDAPPAVPFYATSA